MYYSVKTLLENGKSISEIARTFDIDRKTVRKIKKSIAEGEITPPSIERKSILDNYKNDIKSYLEDELNSVCFYIFHKICSLLIILKCYLIIQKIILINFLYKFIT
jgi:hypothetical protein